MTRSPRLRNPRSRKMGFTLIELLVVISIIALLIAILLPALGIARRTAQRMENSAQLRGIQQSMITFSNSNGDKSAGMDNKGRILGADLRTTGSAAQTGDFVQARFWILLDGDYFTPDYCISPSDTFSPVPYVEGSGTTTTAVEFSTGTNGEKNYSYAMLRILKGTQSTTGSQPRPFGIATTDQPRATEWSSGLNSQAVMMSDRNTGSNALTGARSIHTDEADDWAGSLVWGDGHAGYETERYHETKYGNGQLNRPTGSGNADNLFDDLRIGTGQIAGANALMVVQDANTVFTNEGGS